MLTYYSRAIRTFAISEKCLPSLTAENNDTNENDTHQYSSEHFMLVYFICQVSRKNTFDSWLQGTCKMLIFVEFSDWSDIFYIANDKVESDMLN